jgi:hypothetical protein
MKGGFFCIPSTKKRSSINEKPDKSKKGKKTKKSKGSKMSMRKYVRGSQQGGSKNNKKSMRKRKQKSKQKTKKPSLKQRGGETIEYDLTDSLGQGSYPVSEQGHNDCSGVHHK